jgi:hypothetical protein
MSYSEEQLRLVINAIPTRARSAGIRPIAVPGFMAAHIARAFAATFLFRWLVPSLPEQVGGTAVIPEEPLLRRDDAFLEMTSKTFCTDFVPDACF